MLFLAMESSSKQMLTFTFTRQPGCFVPNSESYSTVSAAATVQQLQGSAVRSVHQNTSPAALGGLLSLEPSTVGTGVPPVPSLVM